MIRRASMLSLAVLLLPVAAAEAVIVPQQGIADVALNMTRVQVVNAKGGEPDAEKTAPNEIVGRVRIMRYGATRITFGGTGAKARVIAVATKDRQQRTRSDVGVGSSAAEVREGVAGTQCRTEFGLSHCWKGRFLAGKRVTDFRLSGPGGEVVSVTVSFVID